MKGNVPPPFGSDEDEGDTALREFMRQPVSRMPASDARELRARVVHRLDTLAARHVAVSAVGARARLAVGVVAAAAVLFAAWRGVVSLHDHHVEGTEVTAVAGPSAIEHDGAEHALPATGATSLAASDELRTGPSALARASLATGAHVDVGPSSRLRFERTGDDGKPRDRIELLLGRIDVQVPKLADGSDVRVHTEDAMVVVHGTKFSVERTAGGETRVGVVEGKVMVYTSSGERMLLAGSSWVAAPPPPVTPDADGQAPHAADSTSASDPAAATTLKAENALLAEALRLERTRENDLALARLDELLALDPASPLAETVRVERIRVLQALGARERLVREGGHYLTDYPHGFARKEVARLIGTPKASDP